MLAAFNLPHFHHDAKIIDLPSSERANRLPYWCNDSILSQHGAGLEAAGDDGSSGSCAERRAEDARCHCRRCSRERGRSVYG